MTPKKSARQPHGHVEQIVDVLTPAEFNLQREAPPAPPPVWRKGDPREVLGTATVIIWTGSHAVTGWVQAEHGYSIELSPDVPGGRRRDAGYISESQLWEPEWFWALPPKE